jgi:acetoin utilization deacetylase AcuC-like enzyme
VRAFYSDHFVLPLPEGHRFPMAKYAMLRNRLANELPSIALLEAPAASEADLALVHAPAYIGAIADGSIDAKLMREIGFPWSAKMVERSRRSVGASIAAARCALREGIAANLAGGTHHAYADKGGGFCVFNDFAVATRIVQREGALRVAIIDLDVHQGNGTAAIFRGDPSVFTLSMHGAKNFPFRKEASSLDVDLPDGCADDAYLEALHQALGELRSRDPQFVFYLAGADPHEGDRLGRLKITHDGLEARDRTVLDFARQLGVPLAFAMGGGYGHDLATTVQAQFNTFRVAADHHARWAKSNP